MDERGDTSRLALTRWAIYTSLLWLVVWMAGSLLTYLIPGAIAPTVLRSQAFQTLLPAFGFLGVMIFGMNYHFIPIFTGRRLSLPLLAAEQVVLANFAVLAFLLAALLRLPELETLGYGLWLVSAVAFLVVLLATLRSPLRRRRPSPPFPQIDRLATPLTLATPAYLIASAVVLLLSVLFTTLPWPYPSGIHLYTFGFIALTIYGVALHLLPRFQGSAPSRRLALLLLLTAIPSPAGVAIFILGNRVAFAFFAVLGALSSVLFFAMLVQIRLRATRPRRFYRFNLASAGLMVLGVGFGVAFALLPETRSLVPVHAFINLFGFAGLMIFGVTHEIMPPYAWRGYPTSLRAGDLHLAGALSGLTLSVIGRLSLPLGALNPLLTASGYTILLATVISYVIGTVATLRTVKPREVGQPV